MNKTYGQNMRLFTSDWRGEKTFKMMPINNDCPYTEVIYDPATTMLVVISKISKTNFQFVPKLDDDGSMIRAKAPKQNGTGHKEQRVMMDVLQEYYVVEPEEQLSFVEQFAINADEYDFKKMIRDMSKETADLHTLESKPLVDSKGNALK